MPARDRKISRPESGQEDDNGSGQEDDNGSVQETSFTAVPHVAINSGDGSGEGRNRRPVGGASNQRTNSNRSSGNNRQTTSRDDDDDDEDMQYGAAHVVKLFLPVTLCMIVVVATIASVNYYSDQSANVYLVYTPFTAKTGDGTGDTVWKTVANAAIVLGVVVVMTTILVLLYKYKCYKILTGWLAISSVMLVFLFSFIYIESLLHAFNIPFDMFTLVFCVWNFGCMGMISLHWKGPHFLQQAYQIIISALMALVFIKYLPEWTLWAVLGVIAVWDLVAVLCPHGPLNILVNTARERGDNIFPSLIYSSTVVYAVVNGVVAAVHSDTESDESEGRSRHTSANNESAASNSNTETAATRPLNSSTGWSNRETYNTSGGDQPLGKRDSTSRSNTRERNSSSRNNTNNGEESAEGEDEDKGVKLGLGDFIFYSVLVGKASSSGQWTTTIAAFVAILMGLFFTLILLVIYQRALPALPISIAFGLIFNFVTQYCITPFVDDLASNQIFI